MTFSSILTAGLLLVMLAAALDVAANLLLAKSRGFTVRRYGVMALAAVGLAFVCLSFAVRSMDLAVAYAMWGGFGILGTSLGGWVLFGQKMAPSAWAGIALLTCGLAMLHIS
ncbi:small multidrug resistance protein [Oleidesulfovibrio alaskensis G20]|jgi:spermidine export protein MdtI|uniref:Spermidine export protein MdtI n=1 Tax=Oleidesulfovibrio alaskensis (strain ATCC BAA-1058 / DSM 17464 / G20) TaxID=207559 RepID=Q30YP4_OLEA2|nr:SMR family transporter [Oleidesulfovibrio alaskensis]ABB39202.1 small multidrug resistance protein [Oleidesulfovibrio alaskensis G20]MBG0772041.1 ligand-binding protein SH3 [Oleidesulfovibrio alaskensis]MBL3581721.1 ligand-binding protein SH3 [Oleidesulfovibrio alaskensis]